MLKSLYPNSCTEVQEVWGQVLILLIPIVPSRSSHPSTCCACCICAASPGVGEAERLLEKRVDLTSTMERVLLVMLVKKNLDCAGSIQEPL